MDRPKSINVGSETHLGAVPPALQMLYLESPILSDSGKPTGFLRYWNQLLSWFRSSFRNLRERLRVSNFRVWRRRQ